MVTYFTGTIDESAIWSKALSAAEIKDLYNNGVGNLYKANTNDVAIAEKTMYAGGGKLWYYLFLL